MAANSNEIKKAAILLGILYLRFKFIRSAKASLGPGFSKLTREHLKQYKTWGYEAHLKWGRMDVDLVEVFRLFSLFMDTPPDRILELATKFRESIPSLAKILELATKFRQSIPSPTPELVTTLRESIPSPA